MKILCIAFLFFFSVCFAETVIHSFSITPDYSFDSWENQFKRVDEGIDIRAPDSRGGFGFHGRWDFSALKDHVPHLRLKIDSKGDMRSLQFRIFDSDRTRARFRFVVRRVAEGKMELIPADGGLTFGDPAAIDESGEDGVLDLSSIVHLQIMGDWRPEEIKLIFKELLAISQDGDRQ